MKRLALLGASGHGTVVADAALASGWEHIEFFDDAWPGCSSNGPWRVSGTTEALIAQLERFEGVLVSIGNCATRLRKHQELVSRGARLASIVHPRATISTFAEIGAGTVIMAGAVVNVDAKLGPAVIVNTGATVDHDCVLGEAVHVAPGANLSGNVMVGRCSWVGVGACVRQGVRIGDNVMVGAGAVVVRDLAANLTVAGNPARPLKPRNTH
ncbi:MAG: acetyltransferase [Betaproteobacteria bacterium]